MNSLLLNPETCKINKTINCNSSKDLIEHLNDYDKNILKKTEEMKMKVWYDEKR